MFDNYLILVKRLLVYMLILILGLPMAILIMCVNPHQASAATPKPKATAVTKTTITPTPQATPIVAKMAFTSEIQGLHRSNTYVTGQSIGMWVTLSGEPVSVWAETGILDPTFSKNSYFQNLGAGKWSLKTPKLTENLISGTYILKIMAQDINGKIIKTQVNISTVVFKPITIVGYTVSASNTATIDWRPVAWADKYLVSWTSRDNGSIVYETVPTDVAILKNLQSGTTYEVTIQALRGDAVGIATKVVFITYGQAPIKKVAGEIVTPAPKVKKAIGEGATTRKIAQTNNQTLKTEPKPAETATPTESSQPEETQKSGWSRILIALSILIIAAAAAIGGYYGYEWLMLKDKDKEPPSSDTSSRW